MENLVNIALLKKYSFSTLPYFFSNSCSSILSMCCGAKEGVWGLQVTLVTGFL